MTDEQREAFEKIVRKKLRLESGLIIPRWQKGTRLCGEYINPAMQSQWEYFLAGIEYAKKEAAK